MSDQIGNLIAAEANIFREAVRTRQPTWNGPWKKRLRWKKMRFEYGRYCYIINPFGEDVVLWEWEDEIKAGS